MLSIGINGFGRIGRMVTRAYFENLSKYNNNFRISFINDISDKNTNIHLFKYDSIHGKAPFEISSTENGMLINNKDEIKMLNEPDPEKLNWQNKYVDIVLECSGRFTKKIDAEKHLKSGAKTVIVSAPSEGADITVVYGINHKKIDISKDKVISNGSCTTNCIAPIAFLLDREFGIETGYMTTIHSYTGDQRLVDTTHKDLRRARAACMSMIPSSTGAAKAVGLILPHLNGKLDGTSIRVPTSNVSLVDFKCILKKETTAEKINEIIKNAAENELKEILGYNDEPLVSTDFNHTKESSIFDSSGTKVLENKLCRVMSWYDNEFGFSNRMLDLTKYLSEII